MNSDLIIIAVITALPPTVAAVGAILGSRKNQEKIEEIHILMNSRFDEWKAMAEKSFFAQGQKSERDVQVKKEENIAEGVAKEKSKA